MGFRDLPFVENVCIFPFFAKNGGKSFFLFFFFLFFYSKEDTVIALVFIMYDEPTIYW